MNRPDFTQMTIEQAQELFKVIRRDFILHLSNQGLSQREISRRMGGSSNKAISLLLAEEKQKEQEDVV